MAVWDKQEEETNKAYMAFKWYMALGNERSLKRAAEKSGTSQQSCELWSTHNHWVDRVAAFEEEQTRHYVGGALNLIAHNQEQIQNDMLSDTQAMLAWWRSEIQKYQINPTEMTDEGEIVPSSVDPKQMKLFFEARRIIDDLARRAIGLPASNPVAVMQQEQKELPPSDQKIRFLGIPIRDGDEV